ncbi:MAG: ECF-type sigma factor [Acidobacteriota bacterium]
MSAGEITLLLRELKEGSPEAEAELMKLVQADLRRMATRRLHRERAGVSVAPSDLVQDCYLRIFQEQHLPWQDRMQFFATCARAMRQLLVERARRRDTAKRGGDQRFVTLSGTAGLVDDAVRDLEILELHDALERLAGLHERQARVAELRFFAGLTIEETAAALAISEATVKTDWVAARAWLRRALTR